MLVLKIFLVLVSLPLDSLMTRRSGLRIFDPVELKRVSDRLLDPNDGMLSWRLLYPDSFSFELLRARRLTREFDSVRAPPDLPPSDFECVIDMFLDSRGEQFQSISYSHGIFSSLNQSCSKTHDGE